MSKKPVRVAVTGAAGQIGYALLFRIASGEMLGKDQPVILQLLEIPDEKAQSALKGVMMELDDCAFALLKGVVPTANLDEGFRGVNWALLVGRIVAGAARDMTGVRGRDAVLQGDCMAGVWAGTTFGMADEGLYARALAAARRSMQAVAREGPDAPRVLNDFLEGDLANRDAAFRAGAASGDVGTCAAF